MTFAVVIPAAGSGSRMGAPVPKVLLSLLTSEGAAPTNETILQRTVGAFAADSTCAQIVVCVPPDWMAEFETQLSGIERVSIVCGGKTRQDSVRRGVEFLAQVKGIKGSTSVLVHDGARCCITREVIQRVLQGVRDHGAVTAGIKVVDSICRVDAEATITTHVERDSLWAVQTPQGFLLADLLRAHQEAEQEGISALDDASLVARFRPVRVVTGDRLNIKVTEPGDLRLAQMALAGHSG